jgi:hypothetical protein
MARSFYKISNLLPASSITSANKLGLPRFKTLFAKSFFKRKPELIINRVNLLASSLLEGKRIAVYNGNSLNSFVVKKSMIGLPFKNLIRTKRLGSLIHVEKRSKKKKIK